MLKSPLKGVHSPLATNLAEYILLSHDIRASHSGLQLWFKDYCGKADLSDQGRITSASLFGDGIVMFVGCFDRSAPLYLNEQEVYADVNDGLEYFAWLKDMRDAYAAHKFGPLRQCEVGVFLDGKGEITGVGEVFMIYQGPAREAEDQILSFIGIAGNFVNKRIKILKAQLQKEIELMGASELLKLKNTRIHGVDPRDIRSSRNAFQRKMSGRKTNPSA